MTPDRRHDDRRTIHARRQPERVIRLVIWLAFILLAAAIVASRAGVW